ncbi:hypothetical protein ULMA_22270 [Patiriisocius marinus]|jgi:hypothetical protein|uniref:Uncharacterized protein n=1 Tax=Patiriisocius marinus TaxID=1397112 RepID=A0A5J4IQS3_9FLAO|nr:hypothetical protein [Patiriisocius marinus]GER60119.1 hypothetical protein ULMA_22270 [Patiriisocius marinus]
MTNTYALTDYDVYQDEDYDNFGGIRRRRRKKRRTRKLLKRRRSSKPKLSRPPVRIRPRVVRGRPMKLPPIRVKSIPVIRKKTVQPKKAVIKTKKPPVKTKTPISHLIKKSNPAVVKTTLSAIAKAEVRQLQTAQVEASKKAIKSDSKVSKVVKVIAVVGVVGATGFGIYKFIQNKKLQNGHISTSK